MYLYMFLFAFLFLNEFLCFFSFSLFHLECVVVKFSNLKNDFIKHYVTQVRIYQNKLIIIKYSLFPLAPFFFKGLVQIHRLILGLDVLGNPVKIVRGVVEGTFDLFYEPIKVLY